MVPGGNPAAVIPLNTRTSVGVPIMDDINPWMQGYVLVLDHPFVAISDSDGRLSIEGLPANTLIKFCVWHEKGRIQQVKINQTDHEWIRSRFQVVVKEGETDLGEILVPASTFEIDLRDGKEVIAR